MTTAYANQVYSRRSPLFGRAITGLEDRFSSASPPVIGFSLEILTFVRYCLSNASDNVVHQERFVIEPDYWAELRQLSLNASAAHIAMVAFLEEATVPWSDDQMADFARLVLAERMAISAYTTCCSRLASPTLAPARLRLAVGE
ncbi:hypothetical protein [Pseudomonas sp. D(2018)]|uniref:hypothetical protein n=1 Tax=Pseudomonas sp. D(2018) TaxID=2502238 RepID=UPI0010F4986D|nr:hypothetical protein [Pseudomonas sp. D(2018)]